MIATLNHARRAILKGLTAVGIVGLAPVLPRLGHAQTRLLLTPTCEDDDEPTPAQTEGPYFTANSPERATLREPGMEGTPIALVGLVFTQSCIPIPGVMVELWHADDQGVYDNEGFRLRGHQFTGADGSYRFETIVPGLYPGRTRHLHAKFQAPNRPVLTTQFYFPGEPDNDRDRIYRSELLLKIDDGPERVARFDTVLDIS